jgi:nitronate monooxygenase
VSSMDDVSADALYTPLCDLLGCRYPLLQAPMAGGPTTPELVAAVSNAGGFGSLAGSRLTPTQIDEAIRSVRGQTDRPFGVNFIIAPPEEGNRDVQAAQAILDRFRAELGLAPGTAELALPESTLMKSLEVVLGHQVPVVSFALGDPAALVERCASGGAKVVAMATTVDESVRLAEAGVDAIVAQGSEAGGHRSTFPLAADGVPPLVGTLALVPQVVDAVSVPVVAAGGIADGRGLVAALALGAAGAQIGSRFLVARESGAFPAWKERLLAATEVDTVVSRVFSGRPARGVRNRLVDEHEGADALAWPLQALAADDVYRAAAARDDAEVFPLLAGQALRLLKPDQGAGEIVSEIVAQAGEALLLLASSRATGERSPAGA